MKRPTAGSRPKQSSKRALVLMRARVAGYHDDHAAWTRAYLGQRLASYEAMQVAFREGAQAKRNGLPCSCADCAKVPASAS